jgi:PAS domain S-box-containing protein
MSDQKRLTKGEKLRQWAEKLLSKTNETELKFRAEDMEKLIRELQSFSSDLELKNEELARIRSELEETLEKYVDLYDFSPVGYFTVTETGSIVEVNLTGARLLGVERTQLCKRIFSEFMPPDFRVAFGEHCREILKYGEKREIEIKLVRQDKTSFDASIESIPVPGFRIRCAISDISDRKRGEESLRYLASYPEMNPNPIMEVNLAGNLHYLNPAAKESYNFWDSTSIACRFGIICCRSKRKNQRFS